MFYSTLCSKMDAYFNDVFELNTAKHKLLRFAIPHSVADQTGSYVWIHASCTMKEAWAKAIN